MAYAIFDCSQFLTFSCDDVIAKNEMVGIENLGMKVIEKEGIAPKKISYLAPFLLEEVFELFDQEFIGVFEDWKDEGHPPIELVNLKNEIVRLCQLRDITSLKLIIISCASENIDEDRLVGKTVQIEHFYSGLFLLSKWNFKEVADNLILTIKL
jgi:hypothetical protein